MRAVTISFATIAVAGCNEPGAQRYGYQGGAGERVVAFSNAFAILRERTGD
jgi:hypothetical protein